MHWLTLHDLTRQGETSFLERNNKLLIIAISINSFPKGSVMYYFSPVYATRFNSSMEDILHGKKVKPSMQLRNHCMLMV